MTCYFTKRDNRWREYAAAHPDQWDASYVHGQRRRPRLVWVLSDLIRQAEPDIIDHPFTAQRADGQRVAILEPYGPAVDGTPDLTHWGIEIERLTSPHGFWNADTVPYSARVIDYPRLRFKLWSGGSWSCGFGVQIPKSWRPCSGDRFAGEGDRNKCVAVLGAEYGTIAHEFRNTDTRPLNPAAFMGRPIAVNGDGR